MRIDHAGREGEGGSENRKLQEQLPFGLVTVLVLLPLLSDSFLTLFKLFTSGKPWTSSHATRMLEREGERICVQLSLVVFFTKRN